MRGILLLIKKNLKKEERNDKIRQKKGKLKMKIEFIGTGSIGAIQSSASTLIDDKLLIDIGNGIIKKLKQTGHQIADIENVMITHLHGDHFADIPFLMADRYFYQIQSPIHVYGPKGLEKRVKELYDILFPGDYENVQEIAKVNFVEFDKMEHEKIGNETYVTSFEVNHGNCKPAYGYIVEKKNQKVGFSGDSEYCESVQQIIEQSDFSVLDMSFMQTRKGHMGLEDILKITEKYSDKKFATTHMQDYVREQAKEKKTKNLIIPEDGEIIKL